MRFLDVSIKPRYSDISRPHRWSKWAFAIFKSYLGRPTGVEVSTSWQYGIFINSNALLKFSSSVLHVVWNASYFESIVPLTSLNWSSTIFSRSCFSFYKVSDNSICNLQVCNNSHQNNWIFFSFKAGLLVICLYCFVCHNAKHQS